MARFDVLRVSSSDIDPSGGSAWLAGNQAVIPGIHIHESEGHVDGSIMAFDFAGARLWSVESRSQRVERLRPCAGGRYQPMVVIQLAGWTKATQFNETQELHPGEFRFIDAAKPLVLEEHGDFRSLYLQLPPAMLPAGSFQIAARSARALSWSLDRSFVECAMNLWDSAESLLPREHATALGALVSLASMTSPFRDAEEEIATPIRVTRAMAFIEHNLGEAWLTPSSVAEAQSVSRRYLDDLFLQRGYRVEGWIWERRLQRAAEELRLYGQFRGAAKRTLLQVALDLGFKNPSHFTRTFKARFGTSPREYRKRVSLN